MKSPLFLFAALALGAATSPAATLIDNNFDGVANDTGPTFAGGGWAFTSNADPSTGLMTLSTAGTNYRAWFISSSAVDPSVASGFTVTWNISGGANLSNIGAEGLFLGVTDSAAANNWYDSKSFGLLINSQRTPNWVVEEVAGTLATDISHSISGSQPSAASLEDGFTVSLTLNSDDTFQLVTSGTDTDSTTTGTLGGEITYSDFAGSLFPYIEFGGGGSPEMTMTVDSVTLTTIPEPSALLLSGLGSLLLLRRRR